MKEILTHLINYFNDGNKKVALFTTLLVAILIIINYTAGIEPTIRRYQSPGIRVFAFFLLYAFVFSTSYGIQFFFSDKIVQYKNRFFLLLMICPLLFALKIGFDISYLMNDTALSDPWNKYWNIVANWPVKCILILSAIFAVWRLNGYEKPVAGMNCYFNWKPYVILLLCAIPLVAIAGTMSEFQHIYPKVKNIAFILPYTQRDFGYKLLYELSYGTDFLTIESFFRGFVVLAFVRYVGKDAILPMAAFYCTIHFGKPLFECITSYIGGIILGVVVYNTRSIWGGLIVHLGMAWLMELSTLMPLIKTN